MTRTDPHPTILLADDNPALLEDYAALLSFEGYVVIQASDGAQAWQQMQQPQLDLIICDILMPHLDGFSLRQRALLEPRLAEIPFVFLSAMNSETIRSQARDLGVAVYLSKPCSSERLLAEVRRLLNSKAR
ncbi:MAG: response regulator [Leptospirales bacterium]|nr:response regulator [Leptospirales bacterium]